MYNSTEIANNIKQIAKDKGIVLKTMFHEIGIGENTMANFKKSMPKVDTLGKIADYLNVSMDYLTGRTKEPVQIMNNNGEVTRAVQAHTYNERTKETELDEISEELLKEFKKLSLKDKGKIINEICEMAEKEENK